MTQLDLLGFLPNGLVDQVTLHFQTWTKQSLCGAT